MSEPRLDQATKNAIIDDYCDGVPLRIIAEKYGVHRSYPGMLARRYAVRFSGEGDIHRKARLAKGGK